MPTPFSFPPPKVPPLIAVCVTVFSTHKWSHFPFQSPHGPPPPLLFCGNLFFLSTPPITVFPLQESSERRFFLFLPPVRFPPLLPPARGIRSSFSHSGSPGSLFFPPFYREQKTESTLSFFSRSSPFFSSRLNPLIRLVVQDLLFPQACLLFPPSLSPDW